MIALYATTVDTALQVVRIQGLPKGIPKERLAQINRFVKPEDVSRALAAEFLLRTVIARTVGMPEEKIIIVKDEYGKPFLAGVEDFHFNVSHSGSWVVCATDEGPIGVDIEMIRPMDLSIAARYFSDREYRLFLNHGEAEKLSRFFDLWTLKESYLKAVGKGLSIPLNSFSIIIDEVGEVSLDASDKCRWFFKQYELDCNYKLSVCASHPSFPDRVVTDILQFASGLSSPSEGE